MNFKMIRIELTNRCNLKCSFCYADANKRIPESQEMKTSDLKLFISKFKELGGTHILFTGGECFLRNDLVQILEYSKSIGITNMVFTNGTLIDESTIISIKDNTEFFYISVDGNEKQHESSRGVKGSFKRTINTIELLNKYSIHFCIETVVNSSNFHDLDWLDSFIDLYGIREVIIAPLYLDNKMVLTDKEKKDLLEVISKKNEKHDYRVFFKSNLHSKYDILFNYQNFDQSVAPWVFADGTIMPFLTYDKAWELGNIHDYIDGNINLENIEKRKQLLDAVYKKASTSELFDVQELIHEALLNEKGTA